MSTTNRQVAGIIDTGDHFMSRVAAGGGFAFFGGTAVDDRGHLATAATPRRPYRASAAAQARGESEYIYSQWKELLPLVGSNIDQVLQVEQFVRLKSHADGYFAAALRPDLLGTGTAVGATAQIGSFLPEGTSVCVTGLAVVPDPARGLVKKFPGVEGSPTGKFADVVTAGPMLFTTIFPMDRKAEGLPADVKVPGWSWNDSEIRSEATWAIKQLEQKLAANGAGLDDVVNYTVYLSDLSDLYEFDLVMREAMGSAPPSRSVVHMKGSALPRREGAFGHEEGAARLEIQFRCLIPGNEQKRTIEAADDTSGHQADGVQVGELLWLSGKCASDEVVGTGAGREIDDIVAQLEATCGAAGGNLRGLLRARVLVTDPSVVPHFTRALRQITPAEPPAVCLAVVESLPVEGAVIAIDGVSVVPG